MKKWLKQYGDLYLGNYHDRTMLFSVSSFVINAILGAVKLGTGVFLLSPWFIATGIYYLLLCAARGRILWQFYKTKDMEDRRLRYDKQFHVYKRSGIFICLIGLSYFGVCFFMYFYKISTSYPYYILYGVAAVAFYKIAMAIYGIAVTQKMKSPLLSTMKIIALVDACVSLVAVQCALIAMDDPAMASASSALFGMGCSVVFLGIGIFMLCKKKQYPAENEFDIKDIIKRKRAKKALPIFQAPFCAALKQKMLHRLGKAPAPTDQARVSDQIAQELLTELARCEEGRCLIAVTLEGDSVHVLGAASTAAQAAYETCARETLSRLSGPAAAKRYEICCSIQKQETKKKRLKPPEEEDVSKR